MSPTNSEDAVFFLKSKTILAAIAVMVGGIVAFCHAFNIRLPFGEFELTQGITAAVTVVGAGYFIFRRIKFGNDPENPAPPVKPLP